MTKGMWKTLALMSMAFSGVMSLTLLYGVLAFGSNLRKIASGAPICWGPTSRTFDSVAAAQMIGRLDLVTFLLTFGALGLAISAFIGWWMIRREARDEAREVAADEARRVAQRYYADQDRNKGGAGDDKGAQVSYIDQTPTFAVKDVPTTGAIEDSGDTDA